MRAYKATGFVPVPGVNVGDKFEAEFGEAEELEMLNKGQIELVPQQYRVVGPRMVLGHKSGAVFLAAISLGQENQLIQAGHLERSAQNKKGKEA